MYFNGYFRYGIVEPKAEGPEAESEIECLGLPSVAELFARHQNPKSGIDSLT